MIEKHYLFINYLMMRCFEDYYWFLGRGSLFTIIFVVVVISVLVYLLIHFVHKYNSGNHNHTLNQAKCPNCHSPVEETYIRCPECHFKLKANCPSCGRVIKTSWDICPYCETELGGNNTNKE